MIAQEGATFSSRGPMPANKPTGPSVRTISSKAVSVPPEGVALVWPALGPTCCLVFSTSSGVVTAAAMQPAVAPERNAPPNDSCLPCDLPCMRRLRAS
eukprot:CAMPEP_0181188006 /NCGR_PEP_ID=MMETSP1096-20121128/10878_1 /TAXON_ID=156174 ORGANISM="Chrysochromulina ericina, Strain CCMP281" /NCGR_SAMPLE_ID=MMETSP1096 /ASSEMBLY_ACC=CAM_ASM_000453 /LENGTH=97 /DNA_ID=CAMNT_0023277023 /DNA_START=637 /DNA_END=930 /DNA_ORIENTATION=+